MIDRATILKDENGLVWVAGLTWKNKTEKVRQSLSKASDVVMATRTPFSLKKTPNALRGSALLPSEHRRSKVYSLALAFSQNTANGYAIIKAETGLIFLSSYSGQPCIVGDKAGSEIQVEAFRSLFLSLYDPPAEGWQITGSSEKPATINDITGGISKKKLPALRLDVVKAQKSLVIPLILLTAAGVGGYYWYQEKNKEALPTPEEIARRAAELGLNNTKEEEYHPWAEIQTGKDMVRLCEHEWNNLPPAVAGWMLEHVTCADGSLSATYGRNGGTSRSFMRSAKIRWPAVTPEVSFLDNTEKISVSLPVSSADGVDEKLPDTGTQLLTIVSAIQKNELNSNLEETTPPTPEPDENGYVPPPAPYRVFHFTSETSMRPSLLLRDFPEKGVRVSSISFVLTGHEVSYLIEGDLYAAR